MERGLGKTIFLVVASHFFLLFSLYLTEEKKFRNPLTKNIAVNTITMKEPLTTIEVSDDFPKKSTDISSSLSDPSLLPVNMTNNTSCSSNAAAMSETVNTESDMSKAAAAEGSSKIPAQASPVIVTEKKVENKVDPQSSALNKKPEKVINSEKPSVASFTKKNPDEKPKEKKKVASTATATKKIDKLLDKNNGLSKNGGMKNEVVSKSLLDELQKGASFLERPLSSSKKADDLKVPTLSSLEITQLKHGKRSEGKGEYFGPFHSSVDYVQSQEAEFKGRLINFFKGHLKMPEYGEVKVKMKINAEGNISCISVLSSKSKKNEEYLKSTLLKIYIPWLNKYLSNKDEVDIAVCFTNDI